MNTHIKRLPNGHPQFTVQGHEPLSKKGGCWTFTVKDHVRGVIVHGPTTLSHEAAEMCGRFSLGADLALLPAAEGLWPPDARQMRLEVM